MKAVLTITGSDSCGGAGIQADIKTISQLGGHALTAITSITVQNTLGIQNYYDLPRRLSGDRWRLSSTMWNPMW